MVPRTLTGMLLVALAMTLMAASGGGGAQAIGLLIALGIAVWVTKDAQKHEMQMPVLWGIGVFLLLIVFLPTYFIVRHRHDHPRAPAAPA